MQNINNQFNILFTLKPIFLEYEKHTRLKSENDIANENIIN